jgi:hypothetical protein
MTDSEISEVLARVAALQGELQQAYEARDAAAAERLLAELSVAERRRNRLLQRAMAGDAPRYDVTLPVRERVAQVLNLLGRPAGVSLICDVASARFGEPLAPTRLASLRRDEHRSWSTAHQPGGPQRTAARPVYVVPALTYDRMAPVRGLLALSSWPLELRIVAPASHRVDMLHIIDRLAAEAAANPRSSWVKDVERLLWRLARTVPDAIERARGLNLPLIRKAVAAELAQLADADAAERQAAAERARAQLDDEQQLFGARFTIARKKAAGERA